MADHPELGRLDSVAISSNDSLDGASKQRSPKLSVLTLRDFEILKLFYGMHVDNEEF